MLIAPKLRKPEAFVTLAHRSLALFLFIFIQILTNPSRADISEFLLAHPNVLKVQLFESLSKRCSVYLSVVHNYAVKQTLANSKECAVAAARLIQFLEITPVTLIDKNNGQSAKYIATLASDFKYWMRQDPRTFYLLSKLDSAISQLEQRQKLFAFVAPQLVETLDLGKLLRDQGLSKAESIALLASLIQDLPKTQVQLFMFEQDKQLSSNTTAGMNFRMLEKILIALDRLANSNYPQTHLSFFDVPLLNYKIYHFFVPAALQQKLLRAHATTTQTSSFISFLFNYIYVAGKENKFKAFFNEPTNIHSSEAKEDILSGYLGAYHEYTDVVKNLGTLRSSLDNSPQSLLLEIVNQ